MCNIKAVFSRSHSKKLLCLKSFTQPTVMMVVTNIRYEYHNPKRISKFQTRVFSHHYIWNSWNTFEAENQFNYKLTPDNVPFFAAHVFHKFKYIQINITFDDNLTSFRRLKDFCWSETKASALLWELKVTLLVFKSPGQLGINQHSTCPWRLKIRLSGNKYSCQTC